MERIIPIHVSEETPAPTAVAAPAQQRPAPLPAAGPAPLPAAGPAPAPRANQVPLRSVLRKGDIFTAGLGDN